MFNQILVPLDGSSLAESVLPHTVAIGKASGADINLLRVLDPVGAATRPISVDPLDWQIRKTEADNYLRSIAKQLEEVGVRATTTVMEGKAAESVIEYAHDNQSDLIILSSHGQSGISGWNVSSVVQKIILRIRTSVMIVRAYHPAPEALDSLRYRRILAPLDGSQRAEFVLPVVSALAREHESLVLLAHVIKKPEMPRRTPLSHEDVELLNQVTERNRQEVSRYLEEISGRMDVNVETRLLVSERVAGSLHIQVEQEEADLVILSAHGYSGETRWPYGSVVISFIAYGTTPLLVLQDLPSDRIEPSSAELAAREHGGR